MGIIFNGIHSDSLEISTKTENRPFMPNPKIHIEDLPEIDGVLDYSEYNGSGTTKYQDMAFEIRIFIIAENVGELRIKLDRVKTWLKVSGYKPLIFDDSPRFRYMARIETISGISYSANGKLVETTIHFRVKPDYEVI